MMVFAEVRTVRDVIQVRHQVTSNGFVRRAVIWCCRRFCGDVCACESPRKRVEGDVLCGARRRGGRRGEAERPLSLLPAHVLSVG